VQTCRIPPSNYSIIQSQKGRPKLHHDGYNYIRNNRATCRKAYFACSQYWTLIKCQVKAVLEEDGTLTLRGCHSHLPDTSNKVGQ
jgi:CRISPR/Cas system CMR-associated protein Cmr1 (group 7 of RAMP superfamily)